MFYFEMFHFAIRLAQRTLVPPNRKQSMKSLPYEFKLDAPLPKYRTTEILVKILVDYIKGGDFEVGSPFFYDRDLVLITGRSRSTVRRALDILQEEGWITRRGGKGTFIGERLAVYRQSKDDPEFVDAEIENDSDATFKSRSDRSLKPFAGNLSAVSQSSHGSLIRIAVAVAGVTTVTSKNNWFYNDILEGIDEASSREGMVIEYLGYHATQIQNLTQRLERSRPDVFLCIGPPLNHTPILQAAYHWKIPCALAAVRAPELGIPNFFEDSHQAARDAVEYLHKLGHQRIGFIQSMSPTGWWAFDRYEGYLQGLREFGLEKSVGEALWIPVLPTRDSVTMVRRYIKRNRLSAVISGSYWVMGHLAELVRKHGLVIPEQLSCITFDHNPVIKHLIGGVVPTTITLPWQEMAGSFVKMVRPMVSGEKVSLNHSFPCRLTEGKSTVPFVETHLDES